MWRALRRMLRFWRHLGRLRRITTVLVRHGMTDLLRQFGIELFVQRVWRVLSFRREPVIQRPVRRPVSIRQALEELGPSFVKLGQALSTRPDLVPAEYIRELEKLQDEVPAFPFAEVQRILAEEDLTETFERLVGSMEQTPVAAASLAQVHRATLLDGTEVAVKVQRPGVERLFVTDLEILHDVARHLEKDPDLGERFQPVKIVAELRESVHRELDFLGEARTIERFRRVMPPGGGAVAPRICWELCSRRVLVMEYLDGVKPRSRQALQEAGLDPAVVARHLVQSVLHQIFEDGVFHGDPHPGNLVVLPGNVVGFLDFGITGSVDGTVREELLRFLSAVVRRHPERMIRVAMESGQVPDDIDLRSLRHSIGSFLDRYHDTPLEQFRVSDALSGFFDILHRHRIRFPADLVLLIRTVMLLEGVARELEPDFNFIAEARPFVIAAMRRRVAPARLARELRETGEDYAQLFRRFPRQMDQLLERARTGQFRMGLRHEGLDPLLRELDRSTNRVSFSLMVAAVIIASSVITHAQIGPAWGGVPLLGIAGYATSALLAFWLMVAILRSGRM